MLKNPKYKLITLGCQMNKSDSERIGAILENLGFSSVSSAEKADFILINTCSVRQTAEDRVFGQVRNFVKLKNKKPHLLIGITGCMAGRDKTGELRKKISSVDLFFGIYDLPKLPEMLAKLWKNHDKKLLDVRRRRLTSNSRKLNYLGIRPKPKEWWRGCVVIQTGCSKYCTYCVVPHARGHEQNRSVKAVLCEARDLFKKGAKEIILLGQAVNSHPQFAKILKEINKIGGINRISFASAHPMYMNSEVIKALKLSKMINFLHLPVQSGNNEILKKMNRNYTREEYFKIIEKIRKIRPDIALATDIIVGFPGETKKQFADTVSLYKKCDFDMSYNAMYSPRTGTSAYRAFPDNIPREEKRWRWLVLQDLMKKNVLRKNKKYLKKTVEVLVDGCKNGRCFGLSSEYKKIIFSGDKSFIGQVVNVKIDKIKEWELEGEIMNKKSKLVVVLGPTASGKTKLAIKLAKKFGGEIVNADSRAIYKEMKVGTDRPAKNEGGVRHHLVDFVAPNKDFSLSEYKELAVDKINDILRRGKTPFLVGGTWLYISAVVDNLDIPNIPPNKAFRKKLDKTQSKILYKRLQKADAKASEKIHENDKRRIIRALEVIHFSKRKISEQQEKGAQIFDVIKIGIKRDLDGVEKRVRARIKDKMGERLIRETRKLSKKYSWKLPSMSSLGYPEIGEYLRGRLNKDEAFELLAKNTRRFARYQINTFKQDKKIKWVKNLREAQQKIRDFLGI